MAMVQMERTQGYRTYLLVLLIVVCGMNAQAKHAGEDEGSSIIEFNAVKGTLFVDELNLSGTSSTPLRNASWSIVNISGMTPTTLLTGPFLTSVQPIADSMFAWDLVVDVPEIDCTCYVEINLEDEAALSRLVVYLGDEHHRPVFTDEVDFTLDSLSGVASSSNHIMVLTSELNLTYNVVEAPDAGTIVSVSALLCPAPNGVCTDAPVEISVPFVMTSAGLTLTVDAEDLQLQQGVWQFDFSAKDALLRTTGATKAVLLYDTKPPTVSLSVKPTVNESEPVHVYATLEDGYLGASYSLTWTIEHVGEERRAPLSSETVDDDHLLLNLSDQGAYTVHLTVRDRAGYLAQTSENITVLNLRPTARISLDGLVISDTARLTVDADEQWQLNASQSFDNEVVDFLWVINDDRSVRGTSVLGSEQLSNSGVHRIELIVFDDDGATHSTVVEIEILPESSGEASQNPLLAVVLLLVIAAVALLLRSRRAPALDLPKWNPSETHTNGRSGPLGPALDATVEEDEPRG